MPITRTRAFRLCTPAEYEFVRTSFGVELKRHTSMQLRQKIQRARRLRDKYSDLARRQSGEVRGKRQPRGARPAGGNENTLAKAELFAEALDRFEAQLAKLQSKETQDGALEGQPPANAQAKKKGGRRPARARKAKKSTKRDAAAGASAASSRASTEASRAARKKAQPVRSGSPKAAGHVRGRARRNQARRDAR